MSTSEEQEPQDICKETGESHEPDWHTLKVEWDVDEAYIDVNCGRCGRSGCLGIGAVLAQTIAW